MRSAVLPLAAIAAALAFAPHSARAAVAPPNVSHFDAGTIDIGSMIARVAYPGGGGGGGGGGGAKGMGGGGGGMSGGGKGGGGGGMGKGAGMGKGGRGGGVGIHLRDGRRGDRWRGRGFYGGRVYGYRSGGCGWLRARAVSTGSTYWWNRYSACTGG